MPTVSPRITFLVDTKPPKVTVKGTASKVTASKPFAEGYARFCRRIGMSVDAATITKLCNGATTGAAALPWWTAMFPRVIDWLLAPRKARRAVTIRLSQYEDVYLCQALGGVVSKSVIGHDLITTPLLDWSRARMLQPLTIQNYARVIASTGVDDIEQDLSAHTVDLSFSASKHKGTYEISLSPANAAWKTTTLACDDNYHARSLTVVGVLGRAKPSELLVTSDSIRAGLPDLGKIWSFLRPCAILILAPSGSGKEVLKDFLWAGLAPETGGPMEEVNLAGLERERGMQLLVEAVSRAAARRGRRGDGAPKPVSGLVFVDEIHQADVSVRAGLLRMLENRQFTTAGSARVQDCSDVCFVFAASRQIDALRSLEPPDFWNRMDFVIEFGHPLGGDRSERRRRVIVDYAEMFVNKALCDLAERQAGRGRIGKQFEGELVAGVTASRETIQHACGELAQHVAYFRPGLVSVRHLRSLGQVMAASLLDFAVTRGAYDSAEFKICAAEWATRHWQDAVLSRLGEIVASR